MPTMDSPPPNRNRVEDEIREILDRVDREPTVIDQVRGRAVIGEATVRRSVGQWTGLRASPRASLVAALALGLLAYLMRNAAPPLATALAIASFGALASLWFVRGTTPPHQRIWRGRDIDGPTPLDQWRARRGGPRS